MYNRFTEKRRRLLNECRDGIYAGMLLAGTQEPHFYNKGLGLSQNCCVYGQRLCLLFSQISVFPASTPLFPSAEICAIL